jgi:hypothetical protein
VPVLPVQARRFRLKQGEHVAPDPLPPLRVYPPVRLRVLQVDARLPSRRLRR